MNVPTYSLAERDRRWRLARELMAAEDVEALICYGEHECARAAPFAPDVYFSNDRPGSIVIFCRDADPIQLVWSNLNIQPHLEAARRGTQVWIPLENIRVEPVRQPGRNAVGIAEVLRAHHLEHAAVGVVGLDAVFPWHPDPIMPYTLWRDGIAELPGVTFKPAGRSFMLATICLSSEELAVLRYSAETGDAMVAAMLGAAAPGVTEAEVYAAGMAAAFRRGCRAPNMLMWSGPGLAVWGPPSWSYRPELPRTLARGDVLLAGVFNRFGMKETRHQVAIAIGDPHPDIETAAAIARAAYQAGLQAARVGSTFGDIAEAMREPLKQAGSSNLHPMVHTLNPFGPVSRFGGPDGLDQLLRARRYGRLFEFPLAPGMSLSFEPSAVIGGRAVNIGGTVVIGDGGPIELNPFTAQLLRV